MSDSNGTIRFIEGSPPDQSGPGHSTWQVTIDALSAKPGVWAEVDRVAAAKRPRLNARRTTLLKRAQTIGSPLEAVVRTDGDDVVIYARVVAK